MTARDLKAATKTASARQRFDKPAEPETPPPTEVEPPPTPKKASKAGKATKPQTKSAAEPDSSVQIDDVDHEQLIADALAEVEAERKAAAERYGIEAEPKLPKAVRQRLRRVKLRPIAVELTIDQGAKLDRLAKHYGSQRSALGAAVDRLYSELPED